MHRAPRLVLPLVRRSPMRSMVVGGPYYGSKLDVRTAMSIQALIGHAPGHGWSVQQMIAEDSMLDLARNMLMYRALQTGAQWLVSIDADCSLKDPTRLFAALALETDNKIACIGFPTRCGDGRWNVVIDGAVTREPLAKRRDVDAIGTGAVAFRLGWYAKHWPADAPWFQTFTLRREDGRPYCVGEDYGHCNMVRSLGGRVVADPSVRVIHHTARIGSPAAKVDEEIA